MRFIRLPDQLIKVSDVHYVERTSDHELRVTLTDTTTTTVTDKNRNEIRRLSESILGDFIGGVKVKNFLLRPADVKSAQKSGKDVVLTLDNDDTLTIKKITLLEVQDLLK